MGDGIVCMGQKKGKILVVGSFMMDLIASAGRVPNMGETVIGDDFRTAPGGKGANQAVQCARLGADVAMAGCVGDDAFGKEMLEMVRSAGVDVSRVKISGSKPSGVGNIQLEVTEKGVQNRILVVPGANYDLTPADFDWLEAEIGAYDLVMMQLELPMEITEYVAACAHKAGVPVMLNPAPAAELSANLLSHVAYLSPNEHEAALLTGHPIQVGEDGADEADLKAVATTLHEAGVKNLIVTLGSNGSVICSGGQIHHAECVRMQDVKDPTAAGDSFIAAFCTGITSGMSEEDALIFASHTAAITVCGMGGIPSLPTLEQVEALMKERGKA